MKKQDKLNARQRAAKVALRVIAMEKKAFDKVAGAVGAVQAKADKLIIKRSDSAKWLPKEGKLVITEWVQALKRSRAEVRKTVDTTFDLSSDFVKRISEPPVKMKKKATIVRKKVAAQTAAA